MTPAPPHDLRPCAPAPLQSAPAAKLLRAEAVPSPSGAGPEDWVGRQDPTSRLRSLPRARALSSGPGHLSAKPSAGAQGYSGSGSSSLDRRFPDNR